MQKAFFLAQSFFILLLLLFATQAQAQSSQGIMVWRLEQKEGISGNIIDSISGLITAQVEKFSGSKVVSEADIRTLIKGEEVKQRCGENDTSCIAEVGSALGVPEVVSGDLGRMGNYWILNLRRIKVRTAEVIKRSSRNIKGDVDMLIEALPGTVAELFGITLSDSSVAVTPAIKPKPEPEPKPEPILEPGSLEIVSEPSDASVFLNDEAKGKTPYKGNLAVGEHWVRVKLDGFKTADQSVIIASKETTKLSFALERDYPMNPYKAGGYATFFTGLGLAAFGGIATGLSKMNAEDYQGSPNTNSARDAYDASKSWMGAAYASYSLGGALMVTGIVLWALSPGDKEWWESHQTTVGPTPDGQGATLSFGGRW